MSRAYSNQFAILAGLMAVSILHGCGAKVPDPKVLATVNGEAITSDEFSFVWNRNPPAMDTEEARRRLMDELIERKVLAQKAKEEGLADGIGVQLAIESLLAARYRQQELNDKIAAARATKADARARYDGMPGERFAQPERVHLAVLWLDSRGNSQREERYRNRLEEARLKALQDPGLRSDPTAGFGTLAIAYSDHQPTRFKGGLQAWIETDASNEDWQLAALKAAEGLSTPGDFGTVQVGPSGVFLVRLVERDAAGRQTFEQVRRQLEAEITQERRQKIRDTFNESTRSGRTIEIFDEALEGLQFQQSGDGQVNP